MNKHDDLFKTDRINYGKRALIFFSVLVMIFSFVGMVEI